jgi:hypothetical protein
MKLIVSLLLFTLALQGKAQLQLRSLFLTDTSKAILYIGIENRFEIITPGGKPGDYNLVAEGAASQDRNDESTPNGFYEVRVANPGYCELTILKKENQYGSEAIRQKTYRFQFQRSVVFILMIQYRRTECCWPLFLRR